MEKSNWNLIGLIYLAFMFGITFYSVVSLAYKADDGLPPASVISICLDALGMVNCVILFTVVLFDRRTNPSTVYFMVLILMECLLLFMESETWCLDSDPGRVTQTKLANYYVYGLVLIMMITFWCYQKHIVDKTDDTLKKLETVLCVLFAAGMILLVSNCVTDFVFTVDGTTGKYERQAGYWVYVLVPFSMVLISGYITHRYIGEPRKRIAPYSYTLLPTVASLVQIATNGVGLICVSMLVSLLIIYGNFYVERGQELAKKESQYTECRIAMMVSQIHPDFLFKSLSSIQQIEGNPPETKQAIAGFGKYMRENFDTLAHREPIPFDREMEHVETYVELEKLRFKEKLTAVYRIGDRDFEIPALTLQILVENAIKHGVTQKESGGTVTITTFETPGTHVITVEDDGAGFDVSAAPENDGRSHIGLENVRRRVAEMNGGSIGIESEIGIGTKVTVTIPKGAAGTVSRKPTT